MSVPTSKIHARADGQGRPLGFVLTGGEASDDLGVEPLMALPVGTPRMLLADKGEDGDVFRQGPLVRGILPVIAPRSNRSQAIACHVVRYRDRNRIERKFNRFNQYRRIASRYDKTNPSAASCISPPPSSGYGPLSAGLSRNNSMESADNLAMEQ